ncbi:uncharacterized protein LOC110840134 [Zootermopsis nevadensis]|uniref:Forkhead transcription factor HCM1 n=1 Tax=Zootermopsis nevadensis TaxID=136037 RepID=A0A067QJ26_ZOONE|nr:uncharacterized protein LOC110840134 [Zootermopsis nevadensis]KDR07509.1 Forkhead transcription factor HCM1 [Zootermopsis nevadensis]
MFKSGTKEVMNTETSVDMSSFSTKADQRVVSVTKSKLLEEKHLTDNALVKTSKNEDYSNTENWDLPTEFEVVDSNGQNVSLNITDSQWILTQDTDNSATYYILVIENGEREMGSNLDSFKSIELTDHSTTEFEHKIDTDDLCDDDDVSLFSNFETYSSPKITEVETACSDVGKLKCPDVGLAPWCDGSPSTVESFENPYSRHKKPPFTYSEMIKQALLEKQELTVSEIYQWISDHFPYYESNDERWKNCVRHNLTLSQNFQKGAKAQRGASHFWTLEQKRENIEPAEEILCGDRNSDLSPITEATSPIETDFLNPMAVALGESNRLDEVDDLEGIDISDLITDLDSFDRIVLEAELGTLDVSPEELDQYCGRQIRSP